MIRSPHNIGSLQSNSVGNDLDLPTLLIEFSQQSIHCLVKPLSSDIFKPDRSLRIEHGGLPRCRPKPVQFGWKDEKTVHVRAPGI